MIIIPIPVDKETYDAMSIDITNFDGLFPKWYWYWMAFTALSFVVLIYSGMLAPEFMRNIYIDLPPISFLIGDYHVWFQFGTIEHFDFYFFYFIYWMWHIPFLFDPKTFIKQFLIALLSLSGALTTWLLMITAMK